MSFVHKQSNWIRSNNYILPKGYNDVLYASTDVYTKLKESCIDYGSHLIHSRIMIPIIKNTLLPERTILGTGKCAKAIARYKLSQFKPLFNKNIN